MKKFCVDVGFANLVVEIYDSDYPVKEIAICLEDKETGCIEQDIAIVRKSLDSNAIECLVYSDSDDEDYTHKFTINQHIVEDETEGVCNG